jgi:hypothetical protein
MALCLIPLFPASGIPGFRFAGYESGHEPDERSQENEIDDRHQGKQTENDCKRGKCVKQEKDISQPNAPDDREGNVRDQQAQIKPVYRAWIFYTKNGGVQIKAKPRLPKNQASTPLPFAPLRLCVNPQFEIRTSQFTHPRGSVAVRG